MRSLFRRALPAVLSLWLVVFALPAATAAASAAAEPSVTVLSPAANSTVPLGDLTVRLAVDLGGESSGRVDVTLGYDVSGAVDIPAGSCADGCEVTVALRFGEWNTPRPGFGSALLSAKLTTVGGLVAYGGGTLYISGPTAISDVKYVRAGELFDGGVADATGTFRVSVDYAPADAVAELRLIDSAGVTRMTSSAPFSVSRGLSKDALFDLDLSDLADGLYRVETKARGTDGFYGQGRASSVFVTHANQAGFTPGDAPLVLGWSGFGSGLTVQGPLLSGSRPATVKLTVNGVERVIAVTPGWSSNNWQQPTAKQTVSVSMQGADLPVGTHQVELTLFDQAGRLIGKQTKRSVVVSDFQAKAVAPTLVVGRKSTVTLSADGPVGYPLQTCDIELSAPKPADSVGMGRFCTTAPGPLRTSAPVTPKVSGASWISFSLDTGAYRKLISQPVQVYAARRAVVSAPAVAYGARGTAKVTVQDNHTTGAWSAAPAGITVTLQRQAVGSTAWGTVGSVKTVAGGIASIPFTSGANGSFRAVLASSVPSETVVSPVIAAVSYATVVWRSVPTSATRGKAVTYQVAASPYDAGAVAHLQVRKPGATTWTIVRSVAVPTSTVTSLGYAFPTAGSWGVRVLRAATTQHAAGLSGAATVKVN
ncbi:hypothetical protein [Kribbella italica]|uniref:Uncharacterized protein n=1 Tax=Kribbella italica TaxID=1540520 RepID=A0A7W9JF97_9ACTN|nr:hypothetical protein [Kribbella italica]MBB5840879.1 hypothetical protein [Kribbella italica]